MREKEMGDYLRSSCGAMEVENGAAWSRAMEMEATAALSSSKRLKVDSHTLTSPENSVSVSSSASVGSNSTPATLLRANGVVKDRFKSLDLNTKAEGFEAHFSTFFDGALREETPLSELRGVSQEIRSSTAIKNKTSTGAVNSHRKPPAAKMPPPAEIEEFFSAAEKYQQQRFAEKYNYDIVRDVAMEGRYQWVRLKP